MSTVVALKTSPLVACDPAIVAIENYWAAVKTWKAADRRVKRLRKKLPEDLMREPRVQVGTLLRGKDDTGADVKEPIYAHSVSETEYRIRKDCETMIRVHTSPHWV